MPNPLPSIEQDNIRTISNYENVIMNSRDIYPDASYVLLTEYDLALSKSVLQRAPNQMATYPSTPTHQTNIGLVQAAINQALVEY